MATNNMPRDAEEAVRQYDEAAHEYEMAVDEHMVAINTYGPVSPTAAITFDTVCIKRRTLMTTRERVIKYIDHGMMALRSES